MSDKFIKMNMTYSNDTIVYDIMPTYSPSFRPGNSSDENSTIYYIITIPLLIMTIFVILFKWDSHDGFQLRGWRD